MPLALRILSCVVYGFVGFVYILSTIIFTQPELTRANTPWWAWVVQLILAVPFAYLGFRIHTYWKTTLSKVLIIGFPVFPILVAILLFIPVDDTTPNSSNEPETQFANYSDQTPVVPVWAIIEAFKQNPVKAQSEYSTVEYSTEITTINIYPHATEVQSTLVDSSGLSDFVYCTMKDSEVSKLTEYNVGSTINLSGTFESYNLFGLKFFDCTIIE